MLLDPKWQKTLDRLTRPTQGFRSAKELGLSAKQRNALIKVLALLDKGKLSHAEYNFYAGDGHVFSGHFNMSVWNAEAGCGTLACIGGTAELLTGSKIFGEGNGCWNSSGADKSHIANTYGMADTKKAIELDKLFYPPERICYEKITTAQAAQALRNYLTSGAARWGQVMAKPKAKKVKA